MKERLQKILARAGFGSRRSCEQLIIAGRVRVNDQLARLGDKADPALDRVTVDGQLLPKAEPLVYIALHKPRGVLSTLDTLDGRPTVRDLVPVPGTLFPVGRLDLESEGLILLTNDGELANQLTHPRYGHEKEYRVLVARHPDEEQMAAFRHGVVLQDGFRTSPAEVRVEELFGKGAWLRVILREGHKRQIRETCAQIGLPVVRIIRVRMGNLHLGKLKPREWRYLTEAEVEALRQPVERKSAARSGAEKFGARTAGVMSRRNKPAVARKPPAALSTSRSAAAPAKKQTEGRSSAPQASGQAKRAPAQTTGGARKPPAPSGAAPDRRRAPGATSSRRPPSADRSLSKTPSRRKPKSR